MTKRTYTYKNEHGKNIAKGQRKFQDDRLTSMNTCFVRARAQAWYRNEEWDLTVEEYIEMWDEHYDNKGRGKEDYAWTRIDQEGPWTKDNIIIGKRGEIIVKNNMRKGIYQFVTPKGTFRTQRIAAAAHGVPLHTIRKWAKLWPDKYYYLKDRDDA